jgi:hypothetical protein
MTQALILSSGHDHLRIERSGLDLDLDDLARFVMPGTGVVMRAAGKPEPVCSMSMLRTLTLPADLHEQLWETVLPRLAAGEAVDTQLGQGALAALSFLLETVSTGFEGALAVVAEIATGAFGLVPTKCRPSPGDAATADPSSSAIAWINLDDEPQLATIILTAMGQPRPMATFSISAGHGICWDPGTVCLGSAAVASMEPCARLVISAQSRLENSARTE